MSSISTPVRVAIVNDYEVVVAGLAAILSSHHQVDVVELDSRLPALSDVDVVLVDTFARAQGPRVDLTSLTTSPAKVVVLSWNVSPDVVQQTLAAGAHGYVSKAATGGDLVDALLRVHAGEVVVPDAVDEPIRDDGDWPGTEAGLSARESEVLALICQGLSNEEIAAHALIGVNTVKTYIRTLYRKIDVDSRTRAVLWGIEHGFRPDRSRTLRDDQG